MDKAIVKIERSDEHLTNSRYGVWKYTIPLPPDSLMWSVGGQNVENFLVVGDAWAQVVSGYTTPDCSVLDIGCGCGRTARMLVNNRFISTYVGFDVIATNVNWCNMYIKPAFEGRSCRFHFFDIYSKEYNPKGTLQAKELGSSTLMYGKKEGGNAQMRLIEHMFTTTSCSETYHGHYHTVKGSRLSRPMHRVC